MKRIATRKDIRRAAGRLILCGFDGTSVSAEVKELLREVCPAGIILFARNVESPEQVVELNRELKSLRQREPLLLAVDQEGGRVARIRAPATEWPSMRALGRIGDADLVRRVATGIARELRAMNFDVDFAPVLDVDSNPNNPVIGDRAFSGDPQQVAHLGAAFVTAMQAAGVGACGKHFPGHGDTDLDSHLALPRVTHDLARLRRVEWPPFKAAIEAGLGAVMTAHVVVESLDDEYPATLSARALRPLRDELKFRGVVLSDDLEMKAVAEHYSIDKMTELGLKAGVDAFLVCHDPAKVLALYRAIVVAAEEERLAHDLLLDAEARMVAWRDRFYAPATRSAEARRIVGSSQHQALSQEVTARLAQVA